jgi:AraC-like DNA-binding protein
MNIPIENVVMLIGAAQGALIGLIIVQKHSALYANRFLALMMFAISAVLVHMVLDDLGMYHALGVLFPMLLALSLAVTPLHFLYAKFLTNRSLRFRLRDAIHFIPYGLFLVIGVAVLSDTAAGRNVFLEHTPVEQYPVLFFVFNWALIAQGMSYVVVILYRIHTYDNEIKKVYSSIENRQLRWLRNITLLAATAWCSFAIEQTFLSFHINLSNFMISSILLALYVFTLGYLGMLKVEVLASASTDMEIALTEAAEEPIAADPSKYEKSGLTAEAAAQYKDMILRVMEEEKLYRQSDLTLSQLAASIHVSPHNLSEVINMKLGKTFYDLVNEYRIAEVKEALLDPSKRHLKILALAYEAGFNSKASFNTIFKQLTHATPSEFRKNAPGNLDSPEA